LSINAANNAASAEPAGLFKVNLFVLLRSGNCIELVSGMTITLECIQSWVKKQILEYLDTMFKTKINQFF
jgi:hypothetical protein